MDLQNLRHQILQDIRNHPTGDDEDDDENSEYEHHLVHYLHWLDNVILPREP